MAAILSRTPSTEFEDDLTEWQQAWLDFGFWCVNAPRMHGDNAGIMAHNTYAVVEIR